MCFTFENTGRVGVLKFHGDLTAEHTDEIMSALMVSVTNADYLIVNLESVTEMDTGSLSMFCAACGNCLYHKKIMTFAGNRSGAVKRALADGYHFRPGRHSCETSQSCRFLRGSREDI